MTVRADRVVSIAVRYDPSMDASEKYRKEQDLIFQEMEEKAALQRQAIGVERVEKLQRKRKAAGVEPSVVSEMLASDHTVAQVIEFLDAEIVKNYAKTIMTIAASKGESITEEEALKRSTIMHALP